jgi:hypothetical protein
MYQGLTLISEILGPVAYATKRHAHIRLDSLQGRFGRSACCATNAVGVDIGQ